MDGKSKSKKKSLLFLGVFLFSYFLSLKNYFLFLILYPKNYCYA
jgi:hypothetical protein